MARWLLVSMLVTAAWRTDALATPPSCYVLNNTDHVIRLRGGLAMYDWAIFYGMQSISDGNQKLDLVCDKPDGRMRLVGTTGALKAEPLPAWFGAGSSSDGIIWVATNKHKGAITVEVDGRPVVLKKGEGTQTIDVRARLLAAEIVTAFDPRSNRRTWSIPVDVKVKAGKDTGEYLVAVDAYGTLQKLLQELLAADKSPVSWASASDHAGPAIVFPCVARRPDRIVDYDFVRSPSTLASLSLVAVCERKPVKVDTCPPPADKFAHGERISRFRVDGNVKLVEAKTSKVLAVVTLRGGDPGPCRDSATEAIDGAAPSTREILTWIDTVK